MKILYIINGLDIGGSENYAISLLNGFYNKGIKVALIILSNKTALKHRLNPNIPVYIYPRQKKLDFSVIKRIRQVIIAGEYNVIISSYILYTRLALLNTQILTLYPVHITQELNIKEFILNYIDFHLKRKNEIFLTTINKQTEYLVKHYYLNKDFFTMIFNGVDTDKFTYSPNDFDRKSFLIKAGINPEHIIILKVAGFRKEKRHIDAINAFSKLSILYNNISLVIVGDNRIELYNQLKSYISDSKIKNVHLFPNQLVQDIRFFYWASDFFVLTSNKVETFSISALEAMSTGLPCVLTDIGGAADIIHEGINGYLVKPDNIESIQNGWTRMINNLQNIDKSTIRKYIIDNYSIERSRKAFLNVINNHL
ncbi:MAG TPA: glycosyltransferase family 4 protein [bacterium]|nr:glycosyltransferase family 4 protein [bacterium]HPN42132.1 glycosyltransferase family 4 protein [bacterium]